jgi:hypothetical protein
VNSRLSETLRPLRQHDRTADGSRYVIMRASMLRMINTFPITRARATLQARELIACRQVVEKADTPGQPRRQRSEIILGRCVLPYPVGNRKAAPIFLMKAAATRSGRRSFDAGQ